MLPYFTVEMFQTATTTTFVVQNLYRNWKCMQFYKTVNEMRKKILKFDVFPSCLEFIVLALTDFVNFEFIYKSLYMCTIH